MAVYSFESTESIGIPEQITITDTSVSPSGSLTGRLIELRLANGNWLTEDGESETVSYITWLISDVAKTLDVLSQSTAMDITVFWLIGSTTEAEVTEATAFVEFDYLFAYDLIGSETSNPAQVQDTVYYSNFIKFIVNLFNGENAVLTGSDIWSSQQQLNKNYVMEQNESDFF